MDEKIEIFKQSIDEINDALLDEDTMIDRINNVAQKLNISNIIEDDFEEKFNKFLKSLEEVSSENIEMQDYLYLKINEELVPFLSNDEKKIERLKLVNDSDKKEIICSLKNDNDKIQMIKLFQIKDEYSIVDIIKSMSDIEKIIHTIQEVDLNHGWFTDIFNAIKDSDKIEFIKRLEITSDELFGMQNQIANEEIKIKIQDALDKNTYEKCKLFDASDKDKLNALKNINNKRTQCAIIASLSEPGSDKLKIEFLEKGIFKGFDKVSIIASLKEPGSDKLKIEFLVKDNYQDSQKAFIISSLNESGSDEIKVNFIKKSNFSFRDKTNIIASIIDSNKKIELLGDIKEVEEPRQINKIINTLPTDRKKDGIKSIEDTKIRIDILLDNENPEDIIKELKEYEKEGEKIYPIFRKSKNVKPELLKENLDIFLIEELNLVSEDFENISTKENLIKKLFETNNDIVKTLNFKMLDQKYVETLEIDKINLIGCFPEIQEKILNLEDDQYEMFLECINRYVEKTQNNTEEWAPMANLVLDNLPTYSELVKNIFLEARKDEKQLEDIDFEKITKILESKNDYKIETLEDVKKYEEIIETKLEELLKKGSLEEKKKAVIQKVFGHDFDFAKTIIRKYGDDIDSISECDEKNYVIALKEILDIEDKNVLEEIYECPKLKDIQLNKIYVERQLKTQYGRLFNEGLLKTENLDKAVGEENVYLAGTDFKMMITSVGAYAQHDFEEYERDWNRPALASQHFCASYIRNDMIGTAPIKSICYGFTEMADDALMLSGPVDIYSSKKGFESKAGHSERYYIPDEQINRTEGYNEMDFRRIQNGVKKQPDYIVIFDKSSLEEAKKASEQFENLPIVMVDVDKCLESEKAKLDEMVARYESGEKTQELYDEIQQKIRNNRQTTQNRNFGEKEEFAKDLEIELPDKEKLRENHKETTSKEVSIVDLETNNEEITPEERREEVSKMRKLILKVKEIKEREER